MTPNAYTQIFSSLFPFWDKLPAHEQELLYKSTLPVSYKKGQIIHDGTECTGMILVQKGCLRAYMLSDEGKEVTLYRLRDGNICMLSASCVLQSITFDVFIEAEEASEALLINGKVFADMAERNAPMKIYALDTAVGRFSNVMWIMQQILFMSLDKRLALYLLEESAVNNSDTIKATHDQIARHLGSAREVISRMLKYFTAEGIIQSARGEIKILDKSRLELLSK